MGFQWSKRQHQAPGYNLLRGLPAKATTAMNVDISLTAATNGVKFGRHVRVKTDGSVVPTTGTVGRAGIGISLSSASSGSQVQIRVFGIAPAVASTAAIAKGAFVRSVGAGSTATSAGTVITLANTTVVGTNPSCLGMALTSAAAAAISTARTVNVMILHSGRVLV